MEPSHRCRTLKLHHPAHAHHHHFHVPPPLPSSLPPTPSHVHLSPPSSLDHLLYPSSSPPPHLSYHSNVNASFASPLLQNSEPVGAFPLQKESNLEARDIGFKDDPDYETQMLEAQDAEGEVEEPVFVLTDEWGVVCYI